MRPAILACRTRPGWRSIRRAGHLFILDASGPRLVRVEPEPDGTFDGAVVASVDLQPTGLVDVRGLAFDPHTGHLHVFSPAGQKLYELTQTGQVVATRDLTEFSLGDLQGMAFAPTGDLTDDPSELSLYVAVDGGSSEPQRDQVLAGVPPTGAIVELTFNEPVTPAATTAAATLVQTIDTSQWSPPSPDPSGITYLPHRGTLLIADGEVNEMPIFTGDNLFEASLSGNLVDTLSTMFLLG